jgi:hypothetical protein
MVAILERLTQAQERQEVQMRDRLRTQLPYLLRFRLVRMSFRGSS